VSATPATEAPAERNVRSLGTLVFGALVLASVAAFFVAQRLKHIPTAVQALRFDAAFFPDGGGAPPREPISFEIERSDRVTVEILDAKGDDVATLARGRPLGAYQTYSLSWDGRRGAPGPAGQPAGSPAPSGEYRVLIVLAKRKVEIRSPSRVQLIRGGG
jgi:hypothetical protein